MVQSRNATVTLPDRTRYRSVRVRLDDGVLIVTERRTGVELYRAEVLDDEPATTGRRWSLLTGDGVVTIQTGCRCGG